MNRPYVLLKEGTRVKIKINKQKRSNSSLNTYKPIDEKIGLITRDYTDYDHTLNRRVPVVVEGFNNPKSTMNAFWLFHEEVTIIKNPMVYEAYEESLIKVREVIMDNKDSLNNHSDERKLNENIKGELKEMNTLDKIKETACKIIEEYKIERLEYIGKQNQIKSNNILKTSKVKELIEKYRVQLFDDLRKIRGINKDDVSNDIKLKVYTSDSFGNHVLVEDTYITADEKIELHELYSKKTQDESSMVSLCNNLVKSLDLCETRDQVLQVLEKAGLVDKNGIVIAVEKVKSKLFE